ncbi:MAG: alpha-1,2-fucosyltransferase [Paludibacteraceae bacterium]|nr:alpha-1,2-fucosyltransferase [Paludibacteraceae bacterium]HOU69646.1 alpha-1,2-fucosyltransferase [Paludibacteraceae bacterium]
MKIVSIGGGLGNQMFKYAFALVLKQIHPNEKIYIDSRFCRYLGVHNGYELNRLFNLEIKEASFFNILFVSKRAVLSYLYFFNKKLYDMCISYFYDHADSHYVEDYLSPSIYNKDILYSNKSIYYDIGAQVWKYYENYRVQISEAFRFKISLDDRNLMIENEILKSNSVGVHIRGGDYLSKGNNLSYNLCNVSYYQIAMNILRDKHPKLKFFVFTNDIDYFDKIKDLIFFKEEDVIVVKNEEKDSFKDIILMSKCQNLIIANSSFSWWGAWLNNRTDTIVIAPKNWLFNKDCFDVCPPNWLRV